MALPEPDAEAAGERERNPRNAPAADDISQAPFIS